MLTESAFLFLAKSWLLTETTWLLLGSVEVEPEATETCRTDWETKLIPLKKSPMASPKRSVGLIGSSPVVFIVELVSLLNRGGRNEGLGEIKSVSQTSMRAKHSKTSESTSPLIKLPGSSEQLTTHLPCKRNKSLTHKVQKVELSHSKQSEGHNSQAKLSSL
eukprot:Lithocolla_globosa_v1_NODE_3612_length_1623_cov_11.550383.p2 type:complete len:162 gc:universal NODE_3612_length_1623_cov_11.550383:722-1207(+)